MSKRADETQEEYTARRRATYAANAEAVKARAYAWAKANPDKVKESNRKSKARQESKDARNARDRAWAAANREKDREHKRAVYAANPEKMREQQRAWRKANPDLIRARYLAKYGLTTADYDKMLQSQNGRCAICLCPSSENKRGLFIDHDHNTGKVRALLCHRCNIMIGQALESVSRLRSAIRYLQLHNTVDSQGETLPLFAGGQK